MTAKELSIDSFEQIMQSTIEKTLKSIPVLDSSVDYWLVRSQKGKFYTDFNINNYVGIAFNEITLEDIKSANNSAESLKTIVKQKLINTPSEQENELENYIMDEFIEQSLFDDDIEPLEPSSDFAQRTMTENQYGTWTGQLLRFVNNLKINDIVVVPSERSEFLLVGRITGNIYEITDEDLHNMETSSNYKKSNFKKRWPVEWYGSFDRNNADSKLYKMIYAQTTLSNINDYKPFINRAIFPVYLQDNKLFTSMYVSQPNDIDSEYLGQFIYQYSLMNKAINPESKVVSKVNVQSEGIVELISNLAPYGLGAFSFLSVVLVSPFGGEIKIFGQSLKIPGLLKGYQDYQTQKLNNEAKKADNESKKLDNLIKAVELSEKLKVPISELGIKYPPSLMNEVTKNFKDSMEDFEKSQADKRESEKKSHSDSSDKETE